MPSLLDCYKPAPVRKCILCPVFSRGQQWTRWIHDFHVAAFTALRRLLNRWVNFPLFQTWCSPDPGLCRIWQILQVVRGGYTSYSLWMSGCLFLSDMKLQQSWVGGGGRWGRRLKAVPVIYSTGERYEENRLGNWKRLAHRNWNT